MVRADPFNYVELRFICVVPINGGWMHFLGWFQKVGETKIEDILPEIVPEMLLGGKKFDGRFGKRHKGKRVLWCGHMSAYMFPAKGKWEKGKSEVSLWGETRAFFWDSQKWQEYEICS